MPSRRGSPTSVSMAREPTTIDWSERLHGGTENALDLAGGAWLRGMVISRRVVCCLPYRLRPEGHHQLVRRTEPAGYEWLPQAVHAANPYTSDKGNEADGLWDRILSSALEESNFGIVCLTARNLESRWLDFEAGALSKAATQARVVSLLYGLTNNDLGLPLSPHQDEAG